MATTNQAVQGLHAQRVLEEWRRPLPIECATDLQYAPGLDDDPDPREFSFYGPPINLGCAQDVLWPVCTGARLKGTQLYAAVVKGALRLYTRPRDERASE